MNRADTPEQIVRLYDTLTTMGFGLLELIDFLEHGTSDESNYPLFRALLRCLREAAAETKQTDVPFLMADAYRRAFYVKESAVRHGLAGMYENPKARDEFMSVLVEALSSTNGQQYTQLTLSADAENAH